MIDDMNTEKLMKLELSGGVITSGKYPHGLTSNSSLEQWYLAFPNVDKKLIERWATYVNASFDLQQYLTQLT